MDEEGRLHLGRDVPVPVAVHGITSDAELRGDRVQRYAAGAHQLDPRAFSVAAYLTTRGALWFRLVGHGRGPRFILSGMRQRPRTASQGQTRANRRADCVWCGSDAARAQRRQMSLNGSGLIAVYRTVLVIEACPRKC
jgi:hypothetical protein